MYVHVQWTILSLFTWIGGKSKVVNISAEGINIGINHTTRIYTTNVFNDKGSLIFGSMYSFYDLMSYKKVRQNCIHTPGSAKYF